MGGLSLVDAIQLASSLGILSGGAGVLRWSLKMERRVQTLELTLEFMLKNATMAQPGQLIKPQFAQ